MYRILGRIKVNAKLDCRSMKCLLTMKIIVAQIFIGKLKFCNENRLLTSKVLIVCRELPMSRSIDSEY